MKGYNSFMEEQAAERRDYGREFEEEVKTFLEETLQFSDVRGGQDFHIAAEGAKNQIDACGRYEDVLFVFECKAAGRKTKKNLRQDILATRERARIVWDNYRRISEYSQCKYVRFIFITKKIEIPETEKELFKTLTRPDIYYADEDLLEYYSDLHEKIGKYAIYNFLADFKIHPAEEDKLQITAMKAQLGGYSVYNFFVEPKKLLKFSYVARRRSQKENFYQRMLDKSRVSKIQHFLDNGGIFPTNVVISLREGDKVFEPIESLGAAEGAQIGKLTIKNSYNACWIIDGQHRLYSFAKSHSEELVSCVAFEGIEVEDERRFFLEINREQRPIQPDLIWDLEGLANPETPRGIISNVVRTLNNRNPFLGKIYIPVKGSRADKVVNMAAFANGILNASITRRITANCIGIENPLFSEITRIATSRAADVLERYFKCLDLELGEDHKEFVFGNAGIPIMLYLLEPIVAYIGRAPSLADINRFAVLVRDFFELNYPLAEDVRKLKSETNSEGARKSVAKAMGMYIRRELKDRDFWPKMEQNDFVAEIISMERRIASLISAQLSQITTGWEKQRIPQPISQTAKKRMEQDGTRFDENLDLGDELQIILMKNNWDDVFGKIFTKKDGFLNQEELKIAFGYLAKIRNPSSHGKSVIFSKEDLQQCGIYLQKFSRVVPMTATDYLDLSDEGLEAGTV